MDIITTTKQVQYCRFFRDFDRIILLELYDT
jgi:hypothetical protein